ncbi:hypothetical protein [Caulobacter hibisci]|uniref:DUF983 domain-containing protein n=1 Tax=Caulobacter hibisci TaxID=2035993 RepID=A0ABS0T673_9CAUL|nr:hypothetical protein [Caulobacter hibisci]MBI1686986.1 hypothetical protein [Caulobacter hibisci]
MGLNIGGVCPTCSAKGQAFGPLRCLNRRAVGRCRQCGQAIQSTLGWGPYLLLCVLATLGGPLLIAVFALALLSGQWLLAGGAVLLAWATILLPGELLHAREVRVYSLYEG